MSSVPPTIHAAERQPGGERPTPARRLPIGLASMACHSGAENEPAVTRRGPESERHRSDQPGINQRHGERGH
jgi:hypothetical protein